MSKKKSGCYNYNSDISLYGQYADLGNGKNSTGSRTGVCG